MRELNEKGVFAALQHLPPLASALMRTQTENHSLNLGVAVNWGLHNIASLAYGIMYKSLFGTCTQLFTIQTMIRHFLQLGENVNYSFVFDFAKVIHAI